MSTQKVGDKIRHHYRIHVRYEDPPFILWVLGQTWWWSVWRDGAGKNIASGWARTEGKARERAKEAARRDVYSPDPDYELGLTIWSEGGQS